MNATDKNAPVVAVIDCGSNSIKLLVATRDSDGKLLRVYEATEETRISEGIGGSNGQALCFTAEAISAGVASISRLVEKAKAYQPDECLIVATSAVRDAVNGAEFCDLVFQTTGVSIRLLSGEEEAVGIGRGVAQDPQFAGQGSLQLCDLGGGSLELVDYEQGSIRQKISVPLGAVRLTERFIADVNAPVSPEVQRRVVDHVHAVVQQSGYKFPGADSILAGTGGAVTFTRLLLGAQSGQTDLQAIAPQITHDNLQQLTNQLCSLSLEERCALRGLPRKRADIMPVALLTLRTVLELAGVTTLRHSLYNLRYGLAAELLDHGQKIGGQGSD